MKGIIALDIDGTTTDERHAVNKEVIDYLSVLAKDWSIIFITGRTFLWGYSVLKFFPFHYVLAIQNGAILLEMPSRAILSKKYLSISILEEMEIICRDEPTDFVIYAGYEYDDVCYYRPQCFAPDLLEYLNKRTLFLKENWVCVSSFDELNIQAFPSIKCFGDFESAERIAKKMEDRLSLHAPLIHDPYAEDYYIVQATHQEVSKGFALIELQHSLGLKDKIIIAAGDDNNDRSMLEQADIKIAMATAPDDLLQMADIVAPPASEQGIIVGLKKALEMI